MKLSSMLVTAIVAMTALASAQQAPSIPSKFLGLWVHEAEDRKSADELKVTGKTIEWKLVVLGEEERVLVNKYTVAPDGAKITFHAQVTYARDVFFGRTAHKGDARVTLQVKDGSMSVEIGGTKTEEAGGAVITTPPKVYQYIKSGSAPSSHQKGSRTAAADSASQLSKGWELTVKSVERSRILKQMIGGTLMLHLASVSGGDVFLVVVVNVRAPAKDASLPLSKELTYVIDAAGNKYFMTGKFDERGNFDPWVVRWQSAGSKEIKLAFPISASAKGLKLKLSDVTELISLPEAAEKS